MVRLVILCMLALSSLGPAMGAAPIGGQAAAAAPGDSLPAPGPALRLLPNGPARPMGPVSPTGPVAPAPTDPVLHDTHTVTSTQDSGPGSLRQAIAEASPGDTIGFSLTYPAIITLTSGELVVTKSLTILGPGPDNLTVSGNGASRVFAISDTSTIVALSGLTVANGATADDGGGIANISATLTVSDASFSGNRAYYGGGGGLFNQGTLTATNVTFSGNWAIVGGGIHSSGTLTVTNATFSGNTAQYGGGIDNRGTLTVTNATFSGNAAYYGGGIHSSGTLTVTNATFSGNSAFYYGGGIYNEAMLYLRSTIIANSSEGGDCVNSGTIGQNVANLIEDGSCSPLYSGDPNLGPLGDYGGDTWTHALISPSLAIDHGDPATCPATDQRGYPRIGVCDIGSFEGPFTCEPTVTVSSAADSGAGILRKAIAWVCPGGTIDFALVYPATITLTRGQLDIPKSLTLLGPGAENLTVSGNHASRVFAIGGASTTVSLSGFTVADGNASGNGGGIYNEGKLTVTHATFSGNEAGDQGGGIHNAGTLTVTHATFSGNAAWWSGGGICNEGILTATHATFSGNGAVGSSGPPVHGGGGIYNAGTLTITHATFSGNWAYYGGGGIFNWGTLTVTNATFSDNWADWGVGGGIDNMSYGTLHLRSTIVANSTAGGDCYNEGTIGQNVANLIEDGSCDPHYSGDPNLGPLGDYGGDTWTHPLISPSLAIDHGDPATCPATDQRGYPRHGPCDIGSFEYASSCTPVDGADFSWLPITPTVGEAVTFTGTVAAGNEPISYTWKLDVGSWKEGQVVTYTYDLPGPYTIVLTATNCETGTATVAHTLTVQPPPCEPVAATAFTWTPITPTAGQVVTFTGSASGTLPITYSWMLNVGSWREGQVVTHTYDLSGTYTVVLTATNCQTASETVAHTFTVVPVPPVCQPVTEVTVAGPAGLWVGETGRYTATAWPITATAPLTYTWGNGTVAPTAAYSWTLPGTYTVTVTATNPCAVVPGKWVVEVSALTYRIYLPLVVRASP